LSPASPASFRQSEIRFGPPRILVYLEQAARAKAVSPSG
jgi:hypothetical protein